MKLDYLFEMILVFIVVIIMGAIMVFIKPYEPFMGLDEPKAIFNGYKIYDIVEQKGLMCAEALEILGSDDEYDYFFNCLKSDQIYLVSDTKTIKVKEAFKEGIIGLKDLYELKIVGRMEKITGE